MATRLGYQFLREGEPETAQEFFEKAMAVNPRGAVRARQGLALVALAMNDPGRALELATDSIRRGHFGAKTLLSWPILIAARRRLGGWMISERLIHGLEGAPASVRARAVLIIVRELRRSDMRQWRQIAHNWSVREGHQFPIVEVEIRKMVLASWKVTPGHATQKRRAAEHLLQTPGLSPNEWRAAAKEYVRAGLWEGIDVDIEDLVRTASEAYGPEIAPRVVHSLALSCMMAKRHDIARDLLNRTIRELAVGDRIWAQSVWALARMEVLLENYGEAAVWYRRFYEVPHIHDRFRLQARLEWMKATTKSGKVVAGGDAVHEMRSILRSIDDPVVLMDLARQMLFAPGDMRAMAHEVFAHAEDLAMHAFRSAEHPATAMAMLFRLTRRQVYDFRRYDRVLELWDSLDSRKRQLLWTVDGEFWHYIGLVFDAHAQVRRNEECERFALVYLQDAATPSEGVAIIGVRYGDWLIRAGRTDEALSLFEKVVMRHPSHPSSVCAWYWLALREYGNGQTAKAYAYAGRIRSILGANTGMLEERTLDARALLLLADLDASRVDSHAVNHTAARLRTLSDGVRRDIATLQ